MLLARIAKLCSSSTARTGPVALRENYGCGRLEIGRIRRGLERALGETMQRMGADSWLSTDDFGAANERARRQLRKTPPATAAHYDRKMGRVVVSLASGVDISFSPRDAEGLRGCNRHPVAVRSKSLLLDWVFIFLNSTRTFIFLLCWKAFSVLANGWPQGWAR